MSSHVAKALGLEVSAFFRSAGRSWTTPPEIAFLLKASLANCIASAKSEVTSHPFVAGIERYGDPRFEATTTLGESVL
jgi:hypothetical protein